MFNRYSLIFLLLLPTLVFAVGLSERDKMDFVRSEIPSCISKQTSGRNLDSKAAQGVKMYCECHANRMARTLSVEDLNLAMKGDYSALQRKVNSAREYCINRLLN